MFTLTIHNPTEKIRSVFTEIIKCIPKMFHVKVACGNRTCKQVIRIAWLSFCN